MELLHYFNHRFNKQNLSVKKNLPFITISRETGCGAVKIARLVTRELRSRGYSWNYVDKEILNSSARKLKIDKSKINYVFDAEDKTHADEIIGAFSNKYYKSDNIIRKAIREVVIHMAIEGNIVLVGRGGAAITSDLKKGIHIRLTAPLKWRVDSLKSQKSGTYEEVESYLIENDIKREKLLKSFSTENNEIPFDIVVNCARFSEKQIRDIIIKVLEQRNVL
jgi:cytidylate kinase